MRESLVLAGIALTAGIIGHLLVYIVVPFTLNALTQS